MDIPPAYSPQRTAHLPEGSTTKGPQRILSDPCCLVTRSCWNVAIPMLAIANQFVKMCAILLTCSTMTTPTTRRTTFTELAELAVLARTALPSRSSQLTVRFSSAAFGFSAALTFSFQQMLSRQETWSTYSKRRSSRSTPAWPRWLGTVVAAAVVALVAAAIAAAVAVVVAVGVTRSPQVGRFPADHTQSGRSGGRVDGANALPMGNRRW